MKLSACSMDSQCLIFMSVGGLNMYGVVSPSIYLFINTFGTPSQLRNPKYPSCYEHSNAQTPPNPDVLSSKRSLQGLALLKTIHSPGCMQSIILPFNPVHKTFSISKLATWIITNLFNSSMSLNIGPLLDGSIPVLEAL